MKKIIQASAPGSLMLMGEHAVLRGKPALVCAVNRRMRVRLRPRADRRVSIRSALGGYESRLDRLPIRAPFTFVLTAIRQSRSFLRQGFDLRVESDFSDRVGLGSSAAVTVATHAALRALAGRTLGRKELFMAAVKTIRAVQGVGSGADAAASVWGGVVAYRAKPLRIDPLPRLFPLTVVYSGGKLPTPLVVRRVNAARATNAKVFDAIFELQAALVHQAVACIDRQDGQALGRLFNLHQGLQDALGVNNKELSALVYELRSKRGILGSKISGSGLGDCVIGLGKTSLKNSRFRVLNVAMSRQGARLD